jgi:HTH-type transcriptional regulator, quorum sensing regulator NprR
MNIGERIKIRRHQLNMKQEELAEGIVSTSYLSKIENGSKEASKEVLHMLCSKLGINFINSDMEDQIEKDLKNWFNELLLVNDRKEIENLFLQLSSSKISDNDSFETLFLIGKIRYHLLNNDLSSSLKIINKFTKVENLLDPLQKYYFAKFRGNYFYMRHEFKEALNMYLKAKDLAINLELSRLEIADLYYSIGITSNNLYDFKICIEYTQRALKIYTKEFALKRMAECHINLGIIYKRSGNNISAKEEYQIAEKISVHIQNKRLIYITKYNIGNMLYLMGNFEECFKYFESCLLYANDINSKLISLLTMVKAYYKDNNFNKALIYAQEGLSIIENFSQESNSNIKNELEVFLLYLNKEYERFENLLKRNVLPQLESIKDYSELAFFYRLLADYYKKSKKYKDASSMFEKSNDNLQRLFTNIF